MSDIPLLAKGEGNDGYNSIGDTSVSFNNNSNNNNNLNSSTGINNNGTTTGINNNSSINNTPVKTKHRKSIYAVEPDIPLTYEDLGLSPSADPIQAKRAIQNHMFGFKPFKSSLTKKKFEDRSPEVKHLYNDNFSIEKSVRSIGNYIYAATFGVILFIIFTILSLLMFITYFGIPYGKLLWQIKGFVLWPFGKYLQLSKSSNIMDDGWGDESQPLSRKYRNDGSLGHKQSVSTIIGGVFYYLLCAPVIVIFEVLVLSITWMVVVMIPTAKLHTKLLSNLLTNPLLLRVSKNPRLDCQILLYPLESFNRYYYKYTINGMNVCLVNLLPFVILSLIFGFFLQNYIHPVVIFLCCMLSTIPLSYYNGMAIASISAQTSFAIGALINASFGSIIELILYVVSINGSQPEVARSALTGALLGAMLLIPGLSMIVGGIKHKEQRFNPAIMGVSNVLLLIAVIGAFFPTLFYKIYGNYSLNCSECVTVNGTMNCGSCAYVQGNLNDDPIYTQKARTLMYICAGILPLTYFIGLLFTLKTHTAILHNSDKHDDDQHDDQGHGHPKGEYEWSKIQCVAVLCVCTTMFALVSEKLVATIDPVVEAFDLTHEFLGVTVLGIIPSAAEYLNAVQFSLNNNMPLALEIGASAAVQIMLFQMPVLVFICAIINHMSVDGSYTLISPMMDFFSVFFGVLVMSLVFGNGRTNYFIGSILVIVYLIIVFCFYFTPSL
ncbi:hypothetical protein CYY_001876 [Polysphondylium violaceum]|uniref:DUF307 family protein n=1 Tax=Polysphondylium violaceum TaxID=133409 RepID=A0A8J4PXN7_9MYCE|nr:hypothetical protein CYY_001876 [Polysphondylium violaceum]